MALSVDDITILSFRRDIHGIVGRLYYYQGNFFYPLTLPNFCVGVLERGIREFTKANKKLIEADRKDPKYQSISQLCDLKPYVHT